MAVLGALACVAASLGLASAQTISLSLWSVSNSLATFPAAYSGSAIRFPVIGDWGWQKEQESIGWPMVGAPSCTSGNFSAKNPLYSQALQRTTAVFMDEVCKYSGGCQFVVATGDNFYQCGVDSTDSQGRFQSDWVAVYKNPQKTPYIANLKWYTTFGNHDIAGSVDYQIAYSNINTDWVMPDTSFTRDWTINGVTVRGIFVDSNPWVTKYNTVGNKYNTPYYSSHHNAAYVNATLAFVEAAFTKSPAPTYTFVATHYPLFGTATQYGTIPSEFSGFQGLLALINKYKPTAYFNGHDHVLTLVHPSNITNNPNPYTAYITTGAGGFTNPSDTCGNSMSYSNGALGGFVMVTADATAFKVDFFSSGSLTSQCTFSSSPDPTVSPVVGANCVANSNRASCCTTNNCPSL